ncbi:hypothetical protein B4U80_13832 [Leptotrombidium deliense]|uniref:Uncharacterized protein n=1 Tax=Leptotrombidium deliense TaxID=299467 RepID=A0A443SBT5_9ACAR|nr:hypothetical protein B4U80_13832 [Leptotrombidium deliense]
MLLMQATVNQALKIIKLNTVDYNICDSAPINYDVFMQLFGRKNRKQVYIQSKDMIDEETQSDCIANFDRSTQNSEICRDSLTDSECEVNPFSLLSYLEKASQKLLCLIAFESNCSKEGKNKLQIPSECKHFCTKFYKLNSARIAKSETVNLIHSDSHYLFAVQNVAKLNGCLEKSIISLWLHCNCTSPEVTLIARSHVNCLAHSNSLVIAGMIDASIALWDLNESHNFHKQITVEQINYTLRSCSFSTAVTSINVHQNSVVAVEALNTTESGEQIASIDEKGLLSLWIIVDTYQTEFSYTDNAEGMMPGSKVRLTKVFDVSLLDKGSQNSIVSMKCSNVDQCNAFIIGLDSGIVLKVCSYEPEKSVTYKPFEVETQLTPVTSICCHSSEPTFLVSYKGGEICLFSLEQNTPISMFAFKNIADPISIHWLSGQSNAFVILEKLLV